MRNSRIKFTILILFILSCFKINAQTDIKETGKARIKQNPKTERIEKLDSYKKEWQKKYRKGWVKKERLRSNQKIKKISGTEAIPALERAALISLYNNTDGNNWADNSGWKTPPLNNDGFAFPGTENTWEGITVVSDHVVEINLSSNDLSGTIPSEIGDLQNLVQLYLAENYLTGTIPVELGNLSNLEELVLSTNELSGSIPTGFADPGDLPALWGLDLSYNYLEGNIPSQLGNLGALVFLYLDYNNLTGGVPPELGNLSNLIELSFYSNELNGTIDAGIANAGDLPNLQYFELAVNELTGNIPANLGNLRSLLYLDLSFNNLSGSIPSGMFDPGELPILEYLDLSVNQLTGAIPVSIANAGNLELFAAVENQLDNMPEELGDLHNLEELFLFDNKFTSIPAGMLEAGDFPNLDVLDLYLNEIDGTIPTGFENLPNLDELYLEGNKFTGEIPTELMNIASLDDDYLDIRWNALHTNNGALRTFLAAKQEGGDWESTQTIAPINLSPAGRLNSVSYISWDPVSYTDDPGGYNVYYSANSGGPYTFRGSVNDKTTTSYGCDGLAPGSSYYFVVKARTDPHNDNDDDTYIDNNNTVTSEYSSETYMANINVSSYPEVATNTGAEIMEGGTLIFSDLMLKSYDEDAQTYTLQYSISTIPAHGSIEVSGTLLKRNDLDLYSFTQNDIANGKVSYKHNGDEAGEDSFTFIVSDIEGHQSQPAIFTITINGINDSPVVDSLSVVTMQEDIPFNFALSNWYSFINDPDDNDSSLTTTITCPDNNIFFAYPNDTTCLITSVENYFGNFDLIVTVKDNFDSTTCQTKLIIEPVNDLPVFIGLPYYIEITNGSFEILDLSNDAIDIESPDSLLSFSFSSEPDSLNINYDPKTKIAVITAKGPFQGTIELTITVTDPDGGSTSKGITVQVMPDPTRIDNPNEIPSEFILSQNYPNPFNPSTVIRYGIPSSVGTGHAVSSTNVTLKIYDILGNLTATLQDGSQSPGYYERTWNAGNLSSGIYFYLLEAGSFREIKKMILLK